MHTLTVKGLMALAMSLASISTLAEAQDSPRGCTTFNLSNNYRKPETNTHRISAGLTCTPSTPQQNGQCSISGGGHIEVSRSINTTTPIGGTAEDLTALYSVISGTNVMTSTYPARSIENITQPTIWGKTANVTTKMPLNESGYLSFTPDMFCVNGTVDGCVAGFIENGAVIEACTVQLSALKRAPNDPFPSFDGAISLTETDAATASGLVDNPAASQPPSPTSSSSTPPPAETGAAGRLRMDGSMVGMSMLAVLAVAAI